MQILQNVIKISLEQYSRATHFEEDQYLKLTRPLLLDCTVSNVKHKDKTKIYT